MPMTPEFNGEKCDNEDSFSGSWTKKLKKLSEIGRWTE